MTTADQEYLARHADLFYRLKHTQGMDSDAAAHEASRILREEAKETKETRLSAVNAYERDQRIIKALSEALTELLAKLGFEPIHDADDLVPDVGYVSRARGALASAKEAQGE